MLRDARINQIGEGSNEVLTSFVALVGMRGPGMEFKELLDTMLKPWRPERMKAWGAGLNRLSAAVNVPAVPVKSQALRARAGELGRLIWRFNIAVNRSLITYREPIMDMQLVQERICNSAMEMFASACVLSRLDSELQAMSGDGQNGSGMTPDRRAAELFLKQSFRRIRNFLRDLNDNEDRDLLATANAVLGKETGSGRNGR